MDICLHRRWSHVHTARVVPDNMPVIVKIPPKQITD